MVDVTILVAMLEIIGIVVEYLQLDDSILVDPAGDIGERGQIVCIPGTWRIRSMLYKNNSISHTHHLIICHIVELEVILT